MATVEVQLPTSALPVQPSDCHILVVDDERISQVVVSSLLRKCNYKVTVAQGGSEAMQVLQSSGPGAFQLVLTDLVMPTCSGLDLLRFVRSQQGFSNLPVVMMSASQQHETVCECISNGAEDFLVKPVTKKEVQNIWTHVVKRLRPTSGGGRASLGTGPAEEVGEGGAPVRLELDPSLSPWLLHDPSQLGGGAMSPVALAALTAMQRHLSAPMPEDHAVRLAAQAGIAMMQQQQQQQQQAQLLPGQQALQWPAGQPQVQGAAAAAAAAPPPAATAAAPSALRLPAAAAAATASCSAGGAAAAPCVSSGTSPGGGSPRSRGKRSRAAAAAAAAGTGDQMSLLQWLCRPGRTVQPKESFWLFCEVLLLLESRLARDSKAFTRLRPSRLLLHSTGRVSFVPAAMPSPSSSSPPASKKPARAGGGGSGGGSLALPAGGTAAALAGGVTASSYSFTLPEEDQLYGSPEEVAGEATGSKSDVFSLGMLFFELFFHTGGEHSRSSLLQEVRQRILPAAFLKNQPKEAAFTLALLHPDPNCRPSVESLLATDMFREAAGMLRQRHRSMEEADKAVDSQVLMDFLKMLHQRKEAALATVTQELSSLSADIARVEDELRHELGGGGEAGGSGREAKRGAGRGALGRGAAVEGEEAVAVATSSGAAGVGGVGEGGGGGLWAVPSGAGAGGGLQGRASGRGGGGTGGLPSPRGGGAGLSAAAREEEEAHAAAAAAAGTWRRVSHAYKQLETIFFAQRGPHSSSAADPAPGAVPGQPPAPAGTVAAGPANLASQAPAAVAPSRPLALPSASGPGPVPGAAAAGPSAVGPTPSPGAAAARPGGTHIRGLPPHLDAFSHSLHQFARYSRLEPAAGLQYGDQLSTANMVCSAAFDRDDQFFALAGVSKRVKIFELEGVLHDGDLLHYPVLEIVSRSRLSSVCWNSYLKGHLACGDYEGVVQLWDANTNMELMQFEEHAKRVWSVDFCRMDPMRLASGGDDGTARIWSLNQERSVATIDGRANVCSVQFNPGSSHLLALGTASSKTLLYDLRHTSHPLAVIQGHQKAVSYVRYMGPSQLVTASTDNCVRLWDLRGASPSALGDEAAAAPPSSSAAAGQRQQQQRPGAAGGGRGGAAGAAARRAAAASAAAASTISDAGSSGDPKLSMTFSGHRNERNFVGLSVTAEGFIACGSESNRAYCYYKALPMPFASHPCLPCLGLGLGRSRKGRRGGGGGGDDGAGSAGSGGQAAGQQLALVGVDSMGASGDAGPPGQFVSSVCWSGKGDHLLVANSVGVVNVFTLA